MNFHLKSAWVQSLKTRDALIIILMKEIRKWTRLVHRTKVCLKLVEWFHVL